MKPLEEQIEGCFADWQELAAALIPTIHADMRASDDPDDETPAMCLTVGFTPETKTRDASWHYQTGDNSYSGGAYGHPFWAVVTLCPDSDPAEIAEEIGAQLLEMIP